MTTQGWTAAFLASAFFSSGILALQRIDLTENKWYLANQAQGISVSRIGSRYLNQNES